MKGRRRELNYPFDPAAVSDPACWLPPAVGLKVAQRFGTAWFGPNGERYGPRHTPEGVLDISGEVTLGEDGEFRLIDEGAQFLDTLEK
jgi:hypothetical protein